MTEKRSARHYTDNYYQAVAKRTPVALASPLCPTAFKHHRTTRPTAEASSAQTCHWHFLALRLVAASTLTSNQPATGTVPLSGPFQFSSTHPKQSLALACSDRRRSNASI